MAVATKYLSLKEAAAIVGLSPDTVRAAIKSGALVAYKLGHQFRIAEPDLEDWINQQRVSPAQFTRTIFSSPTKDYKW